MNNTILFPLGASLIVCCVIMVVIWFWAVSIKNGGIVDIFWSLNFPVIALILLGFAPGYDIRLYMLCGMVIAWGGRLGLHLGRRVLGHIHEEEGRYAQLRRDWAPHEDRKLFWFFQAQAFSNILLAVPFFLIAANDEPRISPFEYAGLGLWVLAFAGETVADYQLDNFKKNPGNKGKVCNVGLWKYSRHPNYFFEWMIWMAYFVFALGSPLGYIAVLSPSIILYLLLKVTGIPATEVQAVRSKGDLYKKYQKTTSAFVPWFPKKGD